MRRRERERGGGGEEEEESEERRRRGGGEEVEEEERGEREEKRGKGGDISHQQIIGSYFPCFIQSFLTKLSKVKISLLGLSKRVMIRIQPLVAVVQVHRSIKMLNVLCPLTEHAQCVVLVVICPDPEKYLMSKHISLSAFRARYILRNLPPHIIPSLARARPMKNNGLVKLVLCC